MSEGRVGQIPCEGGSHPSNVKRAPDEAPRVGRRVRTSTASIFKLSEEVALRRTGGMWLVGGEGGSKALRYADSAIRMWIQEPTMQEPRMHRE